MIIKSITRYFTVIFFAQTSTAQQYCVQNISTEEGTVNSLQLWNRNYLLSGSGSFGIKQWDLLDNKFIELDKYSVNRLVIHNNFMFIATGGSDPFIRQYDFLTRSLVRQFDDVGWQVAVNSDFGFGVTNSISIQQFRIADGQAIRQLTGHTSNIRALLIEGDYLFSGSNDGFCKQWLIETGALVRSLSGPGGPIVSLLTVDDLLLLGSMGKIKVYFMSNYSTFQSFTAHSTYIWAMQASGGFLFTASADKLIRQWRLNTWETIRNYTGHRNSVNSIVIIDEYLYSGSSDGFIKKWVVPELKTPSNPSLPNDPPSLLNQKTIIIIGAVAGLICLAIIASIIYITRMRAPAKSSMNSNEVLLSPISTLPRTIYNRNMGTTNSLPRSMVTPSTGSIRTVGINSVRVTAASPTTQSPSIAFSDLVRQETPQFTQSQQTQVDPLTTTTQFSQSDRGIYIPGSYFLPMDAYYSGIIRIYQNSACKVFRAQVKHEELTERTRRNEVAIKIFLGITPELIDPFYQEVSIMFFFNGKPNFAKLVGFCSNPFTIVTDYYRLGSLDKCLLMQHKITSSKKLIQSFAMQISGALNEMHAADFSHSDLKPQNVFVDKNDKNGEYQCYLGDFGLAKILDEGRLTVKAYQVHNVKGLTIAYAAPEFIERYRRGKVTRLLEKEDYLRADVYSLGIMLFELAVCSVVWSLSV